MEAPLATLSSAAIAVVRQALGALLFAHGARKVPGTRSPTPGKGHGHEANRAALAVAGACLLAGGGAPSLDALLAGRVRRASAPSIPARCPGCGTPVPPDTPKCPWCGRNVNQGGGDGDT